MMDKYEFYYRQRQEWEYWQANERHNFLSDRLLGVLSQARWNRDILKTLKLSDNDLEIHRNRFSEMITQVVKISLELKELAINYNPKRIKQIIIILTKIKNYNNETIKSRIQDSEKSLKHPKSLKLKRKHGKGIFNPFNF